jgi:hypothetical protein
MRNLSDSATRLNDLDPLIQFLVNFLASPQEAANLTLAAGILSNLTCNNETNKKCAQSVNAVQIVLNLVQAHMYQNNKLVEPCVCILRHLTNKHSSTLLVHEQIRSINGIGVIVQLFNYQPYNWQVIKAALGLVRNLCGNQLNALQIRQHMTIQHLTQVFYDAYVQIQSIQAHNGDPTKVDGVSLFDIVDLSSTALVMLARDYQNQSIMNELECVRFFGTVFVDGRYPNIQKAGAALLAELSMSRECAQVIEKMGDVHQYIQLNLCNQYGKLQTLAELGASTNPVTTSIHQSVTTMMQRLHEHKNFMIQQQQQQARQQFPYGAMQQQQQPSPHQQQQMRNDFGMPQQQMAPPQQQPMPMHNQQMYYGSGQMMPNGQVQQQPSAFY